MRLLFAALATLALVIISPAVAQLDWGRTPNVVRVVRQALREMDSATEIALRDTFAQNTKFLNQFGVVAARVSVVGPIPAVIALELYWFKRLLNFAKYAFNNLKAEYAKILDSIRFQVQNLTKCSPADANAVIAGFISRLGDEVAAIRNENTPKLRAVLAAGNKFALELREQARNGCWTHWSYYAGLLKANLRRVIEQFNSLFLERHRLVREATHRELDAILERVKQLAVRHVRYNVQVIDC